MTHQATIDNKAAALHHHATFNPSSEEVQDDLFRSQGFFDPQDLIQVKSEMIRRVEQDGWTITSAAATFGYSRPAYYAAKKALEVHGLSGLIPKKRGPHGARKLTDAVMDFVDQLRSENPDMHLAEVVKKIDDQFHVKVHRRSLERALVRRRKKRL